MVPRTAASSAPAPAATALRRAPPNTRRAPLPVLAPPAAAAGTDVGGGGRPRRPGRRSSPRPPRRAAPAAWRSRRRHDGVRPGRFRRRPLRGRLRQGRGGGARCRVGPRTVGDQRQRTPSGHRAVAVGEHPAQPDGRLQLGARPVEAAGAQRQHAQLVVEVGLFGDLAGQPRGLLAVPQAALPGAPVQRRGECRGGRTGEQHGRAGVPALPAAGQDAHRGQRHIGLGGGPLGGDRGVAGPPGVVLGGGVRPGGGALGVAGRLQLVLDGRGEPVVAADRGDQAAGQQLAEGGVGVGVLGEGRQMRLVRQLAAERDGEAQRLLGGGAEPCGEQRGGGGGLPEGRQQHLGALAGLRGGPRPSRGPPRGTGRSRRRGLPAPARIRSRCRSRAAAWTNRSGSPSDSNQRSAAQASSSSVSGRSTARASSRAQASRPSPPRKTSSRWESALGAATSGVAAIRKAHSGVASSSSSSAAPPNSRSSRTTMAPISAIMPQQLGPVGAVLRGAVDGGEQLVQQVGGGAVVAGEPDDAVGGEVGAGGGDGVQQPGAARSGGAGDAHGAAAGEQPDQALGVLGALFERGLVAGESGRARGQRGRGGAGGRGAFLRVELAGGGRALAGRAGFYLAAVDGVDGDEVGARDEPDDAGEPAGAAAARRRTRGPAARQGCPARRTPQVPGQGSGPCCKLPDLACRLRFRPSALPRLRQVVLSRRVWSGARRG